MSSRSRLAVLFGLALLALAPMTVQADSYQVTNLVSDIDGMALITDPLLKNPWGVSYGASSPFWVSNAGTSTSTLYSGDVLGSAFMKVSLEVSIPGGRPSGQVINTTADFDGARFIFAGLNGTISAWSSGTQAELKATVQGAAYTGLAIGQDSLGNNQLYAANVSAGTVDVFAANFQLQQLGPMAFSDPTLDANLHPFNIQNINGVLYVTYENQDDPDHGGIVNAFTTDGILMGRVASGDPLNAPWGLALAPDDFGEFSGSLLVGNFGDGTINAFDPAPGGVGFLGQLTDEDGNPIVLERLWALIVGNGTMAGDSNAVYFTAGINAQQNGLFGSIRLEK